jgi:nicotinamide-nucleotide amidase
MLEMEILNLSRQDQAGALSPWFARKFTEQMKDGLFLPAPALQRVQDHLIGQLQDYRRLAGVGTAVLGMSGGVDSALTAALFKAAGWQVIGLTLPIHQVPEETDRGIDACKALGLEHFHLDLSAEYDAMVSAMARLHPGIATADDDGARTRRGNLRARLRMMTLYDQAHRLGGLVASTDNFSELGAGFWTLHGDVGDLAPVQGLLKSWEIPWLARNIGVPEHTWRAKPTDGLGIGAGDEAQIGATYLEWDIVVFTLDQARKDGPDMDMADVQRRLGTVDDPYAQRIVSTVVTRLGRTWFKRVNPINLAHPKADRLALIDRLDERLFRPAILRRQRVDIGFPDDLHASAAALCKLLERHGCRVVTAESCTGGLLAASIAGVSGSSSALEGSFVTYAPSMKVNALGVSAQLIQEQTVYDPQVARQMATGALDAAPAAGLALAITGVGGPDDDQGKPAGYVCIAACLRGDAPVVRECQFAGAPDVVLTKAIGAALQLGISLLDSTAGAGVDAGQSV